MINSIGQIGKVTQNKTNFAAVVMERFTRKSPFYGQNQERGSFGIIENEGDLLVFSRLFFLSSAASAPGNPISLESARKAARTLREEDHCL